jgi:glycosyltransferase involved in cell wall biosynthesis
MTIDKCEGKVDHFLDFLREHRLPYIVEGIASWLIYAAFISFYTVTYLLSKPQKAPSVSLVTLDRNGPDVDVTDEAVFRLTNIPDKDLITTIRSDESLRRLASQFILRTPTTVEAQKLHERLDAVWLDLLRLPLMEDDASFKYTISLILPAYRESGAAVAQTLRQCYGNTAQPLNIQVIVVNAGHCPDLETECRACQSLFGYLQIVSYDGEGGRGPSMNCGASHAQGKYLTFLHSDTLLPQQWDQRLMEKMQERHNGSVVHACTFTFGHNLAGIAPQEVPWGLTVNRICGNIRARFLKLPYGDHVLSFPSTYFRYIGGFPEQPIMEDYVMMDLLRRRAALLPERLGFIFPPGAQCSIRRWQTLGVVYVTLVNALVVYRYKNGYWHAGDVYDYYYQRPFRNKKKS